MRLASPWFVALGIAALALPAVACRGVLGIHALTYDGGVSDAREDVHEAEDAPAGDDAASESGPPDTGVDAGHPVDAGVDAPKDAGADHAIDAHEAGPVDAGKDAPKDTGQDTRPPPHDAGSYDGCVNDCISAQPSEVSAVLTICPGNCTCPSCASLCGPGACDDPQNPTLACHACLLECIRTAAGTANACGMPLGSCMNAGSGCQMLGGCLSMCSP